LNYHFEVFIFVVKKKNFKMIIQSKVLHTPCYKRSSSKVQENSPKKESV